MLLILFETHYYYCLALVFLKPWTPEMNSKDSVSKQSLKTVIDYASSWCDLKPIINKVPLQKIKQFLHQMVDNNYVNVQNEIINIKSIYWEFNGNIENILPGVMIQYILTFLKFDLQFVKLVNKRWKQLSDLNEKLYYSRVSSQNTNIPYDENVNTTYIIRYPRIQLTTIEKELNFEMIPLHLKHKGQVHINININFTKTILKNGDRIIVYPGQYVIDKPLIFKTNLTIIGIIGCDKRGYHLDTPTLVYQTPFEYICSQQFDNDDTPAINIDECILNVTGCKISNTKDSPTIQVNTDASLFIENSTIHSYFDGIPNINNTGIRIRDDAAKIHIKESEFVGFQHCIELIKRNKTKLKQLICRNNIFTNIQSYPIIKTHNNNDKHIELQQNYNKIIYQIDNNKLIYKKKYNYQTQCIHNEQYINKIKFVFKTFTPSLSDFGLF